MTVSVSSISKQDAGKVTCGLSDAPSQFTGNGSILLKINKMIADNYAMLGLFVVIMIVLGLVAYFFGKRLYNTILSYYMNKVDVKSSSLSNSNSKEFDNYIYDTDFEPPPDDVLNYMEADKRKFVKDIESIHDEYNKAIETHIRSTGKADVDSRVDASVLFKTHDSYDYTDKSKY